MTSIGTTEEVQEPKQSSNIPPKATNEDHQSCDGKGITECDDCISYTLELTFDAYSHFFTAATVRPFLL